MMRRGLVYRRVNSPNSTAEFAHACTVFIPRKLRSLDTASAEKGLAARASAHSGRLLKSRWRNSTFRSTVWARAEDSVRSRKRNKLPTLLIKKADRLDPKCYLKVNSITLVGEGGRESLTLA